MAFCGSYFFWLFLRIIQALFAILVLCLSAFVISWWRESWTASVPISIEALLVCSIITPFALLYILLAPVYLFESRLSHAVLIAGVEGTMSLVWATSSISSAVFMNDRMCFGTVCTTCKAAIALGVLEWLSFMISFAFSAMLCIRSYSSSYPVISTYKI